MFTTVRYFSGVDTNVGLTPTVMLLAVQLFACYPN